MVPLVRRFVFTNISSPQSHLQRQTKYRSCRSSVLSMTVSFPNRWPVRSAVFCISHLSIVCSRSSARAFGAAAFPARGSGVNDCLPFVAQRAFPPDSFGTANCNHGGLQRTVFGWVPFGSNPGLFRLQVIESGKYLSSAAKTIAYLQK